MKSKFIYYDVDIVINYAANTASGNKEYIREERIGIDWNDDDIKIDFNSLKDCGLSDKQAYDSIARNIANDYAVAIFKDKAIYIERKFIPTSRIWYVSVEDVTPREE
jgi:hypothetical protein